MMETASTSALYFDLLSLGDVYPLDFYSSPEMIKQRLESFSSEWKVYNPMKPGYKRYGLSVTSLEGGIGGVEDLTSLHEHNKKHGTNFNEMSFRTLTPVYEACPEIHPIIDVFREELGRTHFLKLDKGGFFPYHRDAYSHEGSTFRLFMPTYTTSPRDFVFLLGDQRIHMEPGRAYFINTRREHALFSFDEDCKMLVMNVRIAPTSVAKVHHYLFSK